MELRPNLITNFGLFWDLNEVEWSTAKRGGTRMLGRSGKRTADFYDMPGVYVLYGKFGVYYAGVSGKGKIGGKSGIGYRVRKHSELKKREFDKFSWFGFSEVAKGNDGVLAVVHPPKKSKQIRWKSAIQDIEGILHRVLPLHGHQKEGFGVPEKNQQFKVIEWRQVPRAEAQTL